MHVPVSQPIDVLATIRERYEGEPMVRVLDTPPNSKAVTGTNMAHVWGTYDEHTGMAIVISAIDNLGKGAAGQAVQNMNLLAPERSLFTANYGLNRMLGAQVWG